MASVWLLATGLNEMSPTLNIFVMTINHIYEADNLEKCMRHGCSRTGLWLHESPNSQSLRYTSLFLDDIAAMTSVAAPPISPKT